MDISEILDLSFNSQGGSVANITDYINHVNDLVKENDLLKSFINDEDNNFSEDEKNDYWALTEALEKVMDNITANSR